MIFFYVNFVNVKINCMFVEYNGVSLANGNCKKYPMTFHEGRNEVVVKKDNCLNHHMEYDTNNEVVKLLEVVNEGCENFWVPLQHHLFIFVSYSFAFMLFVTERFVSFFPFL